MGHKTLSMTMRYSHLIKRSSKPSGQKDFIGENFGTNGHHRQ
ncbi:hypothetical protein LptCag_1848 [Leptospirillum ferriphilum]|uniref:Uncharacterized protein n=1 Tax=Leptospirillum ferriphilum TaxID=178606 RepID=A0A094W6S1_9BACT|nr:hypothetical protein LptCag_1848 [Leptospirillum ferriphilum]